MNRHTPYFGIRNVTMSRIHGELGVNIKHLKATHIKNRPPVTLHDDPINETVHYKTTEIRALKALQTKLGVSNWNEFKRKYPGLKHRSIVDIESINKDIFYLLQKGDSPTPRRQDTSTNASTSTNALERKNTNASTSTNALPVTMHLKAGADTKRTPKYNADTNVVANASRRMKADMSASADMIVGRHIMPVYKNNQIPRRRWKQRAIIAGGALSIVATIAVTIATTIATL